MRLGLLSILFMLCISVNAQDFFKPGMEYYNKGDYAKADSLFSLHLQMCPSDRNVRFNRGVTKLYLNDTCASCYDMSRVYHSFRDKDAAKYYFTFCCKADTLFYDKNYLPSNKDHYRYYEIIERNKYTDYLYGEVHDKRSKGKTSIIHSGTADFTDTDIVATYEKYGDTAKIYSFTFTPPAFPGDADAKSNYIHNSPYYIQAMNDLNLHRVIVDVEYIVDKNGLIKNIEVTDIYSRTDKKVDNEEELAELAKLIFLNMPQFIPGKYRSENVDFMRSDFISFW